MPSDLNYSVDLLENNLGKTRVPLFSLPHVPHELSLL